MASETKLKVAAEEIKDILRKHDIAASIILRSSNSKRLEYIRHPNNKDISMINELKELSNMVNAINNEMVIHVLEGALTTRDITLLGDFRK